MVIIIGATKKYYNDTNTSKFRCSIINALNGFKPSIDSFVPKLEEIYTKVGTDKFYVKENKVEELPSFSISSAEKCTGCEANISDAIQYHARELPVVDSGVTKVYCEKCYKQHKNQSVYLRLDKDNLKEGLVQYDYVTLVLQSNAPHQGLGCNGCGTERIMDRRKCAICPDFDLCIDCHERFELGDESIDKLIEKGTHELRKHPFWVMSSSVRMRLLNADEVKSVRQAKEAIEKKKLE